MARMNNGILDEFSGTIGKVVGSNWKGVAYMRAKPKKRSNAGTESQLEQQARFALASKFAQSMSQLLTLGFRDQAINMTGTNYALSQILNEAITGTSPDFQIDYSKVAVSRGKLQRAKTPAATAGSKAGIIQFTWADNSARQNAKSTDQSLLVAYCPELNETEYIIGTTRSAGSGLLDVEDFSGKKVQTWMSFLSANTKLIANSAYTGEVTVP